MDGSKETIQELRQMHINGKICDVLEKMVNQIEILCDRITAIEKRLGEDARIRGAF